jgi:WD40 repeat protein
LVSSVDFSPDGTRVLTAGNDNTAKIWSVNDGDTPLYTFSGHNSRINSAAFSGDGTRIVTGSGDETARLWNANDDTAPIQIFAVGNRVLSVDISNDGSRILTGGGVWVRLWDANDGISPLRVYFGHSQEVYAVRFSPDEQSLLSGGQDNSAMLWSIDDGIQPVRTFSGHPYIVGSVAFSPDGGKVMTAVRDETVRVWDVNDESSPLFFLAGHVQSFRIVKFSPDGSTFLSGHLHGHEPALWDVDRSLTPIRMYAGHSSQITSLSFSPDGSTFVSSSDDDTARLWNVDDGTAPIRTFADHAGDVTGAVFTRDGSGILTISADSTVKLWDVGNAVAPVRTYSLPGEGTGIGALGDGTTFVATYRTPGARPGTWVDFADVWDIDDSSASQNTFRVSVPGGFHFGSIAPSPTNYGQFAIWTRLYNTQTSSTYLQTPRGNDAAFHPTGLLLLANSYAEPNEAHLWNISAYGSEDEPLATYDTGKEVYAVDVSRDGARVLTGGAGMAALWEFEADLPLVDIDTVGYVTALLTAEQKIYGDRNYEFRNPIPRYLENQVYIRTLNNDKALTNWGVVKFSVDRPVTVYIAHDARFVSPPAWLSWWTKVDDWLMTDEDDSPERVLYRRDFNAGPIQLGPNRDANMPDWMSMYSVIIVPRPPDPTAAEAPWNRFQ